MKTLSNAMLSAEKEESETYYTIASRGTKIYYKDGLIHRDDGPAFEYTSGLKHWYLNGVQVYESEVRALGKTPIMTESAGLKTWKLNKLFHRTDGPAIEYSNGDQEWRQNGVLHRDGGPAVIYASDHEVWYRNGVRHRAHDDGPAVRSTEYDIWYVDGRMHRFNGPAMIYKDDRPDEYWVNGYKVSKEEACT